MALEALTVLAVLAVMVEFATEITKTVFPAIRGHYSRGAAVLIGMLLCVITRTGILAAFNIFVLYPAADYLLTGLLISRGSNIIHDLVSRLETAGVKS